MPERKPAIPFETLAALATLPRWRAGLFDFGGCRFENRAKWRFCLMKSASVSVLLCDRTLAHGNALRNPNQSFAARAVIIETLDRMKWERVDAGASE